MCKSRLPICSIRRQGESRVTPEAIATLLVPYVELEGLAPVLPETLVSKISIYLDLLLRWNARTNLTAIRSPEEIVTRHFGESLFAAQQIFLAGKSAAAAAQAGTTLADIGSGAGFPGLPVKLWSSQFGPSQLQVTLIESHQKKATFLREAIRALTLSGIEVQTTRAEQVAQLFDTVTLRGVEQFDQILPAAARLLKPGGRLALLIGEDQIPSAAAVLPTLQWEKPHRIPESQRRVILVGTTAEESSQ